MTTEEQEEKKIQLELNKNIENFKCFRFNSGAGSGKTYALIESLKYLLKNKLDIMLSNNQKIICVTYTNVAVNEIKDRLGNSEIVVVSTIHEMLWSIIQSHQPELVQIHKAKIKSELAKLETDLDEDKFKNFTADKNEDTSNLDKFIAQTKHIYYQNINVKAGEFRQAFTECKQIFGVESVDKWLKNISNYKKVARKTYKINSYRECIEKIEHNETHYNRVEYDNAVNSDRLNQMKFSHDTLLEYSLALFEKYSILSQIIIDKYPYVFIDEYQDTNIKVVKLVNIIHEYSLKNERNWLIGYFGDLAQNIYDDGVGTEIDEYCEKLHDVYKNYNRRSHIQIINVINKIRNDDIKQKSIYPNRNKGKVELYFVDDKDEQFSSLEKTKSFLNFYLAELEKNDCKKNNRIDCLVLTNALMAKLNGFGEIYDAFKGAKSIFYLDLNTKIFSHEIEKLDFVIRLLYQVIKLFMLINNESSTYYDVFGKEGHNLTFKTANLAIKQLKEISPKNLGDLIKCISDKHNQEECSEAIKIYIGQSIKGITDDLDNYNSIYDQVYMLLNNLINGDQTENNSIQKANIKKVLNIPIETWFLWVQYIEKKLSSDIVYHTYHGTKGEEYENVAIIMQHSFGRISAKQNKFKNYFKKIPIINSSNEIEDNKEREEFENTKNLLYVACSRAIKNLRILYLDDLTEIKPGIEYIFGKVIDYPMSTI